MNINRMASTGVSAGARTTALAALLTMLACRGSAAGIEAADSSPPIKPLSSIAAVRQLTIAELDRGPRAQVRGTVTVSGSFTVIQDGDAAIEIDASGIPAPNGRLLGDAAAPQDWPPLGAVVAVEGPTCSNGCAPQLRADSLVVIRQSSLPPARPVAVNDLFDSEMIFRRVEVRGVAQGAEHRGDTRTTLYLEAGGRRLPVWVRGVETAAELERFVDVNVKIVG
ncbi:MAG: hypothetical protein NTY17_00470, partial [Planctomycetia bacterium]|nr:hypothetical protein [Planctomycetia bacterium]